MWKDTQEMASETSSILDEALKCAYLTVNETLQADSITLLGDLYSRIDEFRRSSQMSDDENGANVAFVFLQFVKGVRSYLSLWIDLKQGRADEAWESLISAQNAIALGTRFSDKDSFSHLRARLQVLEECLFPPQLFMSSAHTFQWGECSICGQIYGECDHVTGRLYNGELCAIIVHDICNVDHVAIVRNPSDKFLRLPAWPEHGGALCTLTRTVIEADGHGTIATPSSTQSISDAG